MILSMRDWKNPMRKKFVILLADDCEVMGNGNGNVADLQYLPSLSLMNIAEKHNIAITFMVDAAHRLAMKKLEHLPEIAIQARLWDDTVRLMWKRGFDVQLHLHPQWLSATYGDGIFTLGTNWNLGLYSPIEQRALITDAIALLNELLRPIDPNYHVCAFKAGAWGLQPSDEPLRALAENGITIVVGVRDGLVIPKQKIDYAHLDEPDLPYYPDFKNITRLAEAPCGLVVIPLQRYAPDPLTFFRYTLDKLGWCLARKNDSDYGKKAMGGGNPLKDKKIFTFGLRPYITHLKIGDTPFAYLKNSFDTVIKRLRKLESEDIPVLIESHTKKYRGYCADIDRFIGYVLDRYGDELVFSDMRTYCARLDAAPTLARSKMGIQGPRGSTVKKTVYTGSPRTCAVLRHNRRPQHLRCTVLGWTALSAANATGF